MSRLDKLLLLLDSGTTRAVRQAAGAQIAWLHKCDQARLSHYLNRLAPLLHSKSWDSRIAAAYTLGMIASNVPAWPPSLVTQQSTSTCPGSPNSTASPPSTKPIQRLSQFDVNKVIHSRKLLLASINSADPGRTTPPEDCTEGLIPFGVSALPNAPKRRRTTIPPPKVSVQSSSPVPQNAPSARQLAAAKRKARMQQNQQLPVPLAPSHCSPPSPHPIVKEGNTQPQSSKIVVEAVESSLAFEWPFTKFCGMLFTDLFNPTWEVRHGASVGLREILRYHANSAGKLVDGGNEERAQQNQDWLEDCSAKLLTVFALDRFVDFVSDQAVAPVIETCAQVLAFVVKHMGHVPTLSLVGCLLQLQENTDWRVRMNGLLGLKYVVAVRSDLVVEILPKAIDSLLSRFSDGIDDVRAVSADTLLPMAQHLPLCPQFPKILAVLWGSLVDLDDLCSSTASIMNLLAALYSTPSVSPSPISNNRHLLAEYLPRLLSLYKHNISSVRVAALQTTARLLKSAIDAKGIDPIPPETLVSVLGYVYQAIVGCSDFFTLPITFHQESKLIVEQAQAVWEVALGLPSQQIVAATSTLFLALFSIASQCITINPHQLKNTPSVPDHSVQVVTVPLDPLISASHALGVLTAVYTKEHRETPCYTVLHQAIQSGSAFQTLCACILLTEWAECSSKNGNLPLTPLPAELIASIDNLTLQVPSFSEIDGMAQSLLQSDCDNIIRTLRLSDSSLPKLPLQASVKLLELATERLSSGTLNASVAEQLSIRVRHMQDSASYLTSLHHNLALKTASCAASSLIRWAIPSKITPVVASLMNSLLKEEDMVIQKRSAESMALLIKKSLSRTPCPNSKIIRNLSKHLTPSDELALRGAEYAFQAVAHTFGSSLFVDVPCLWQNLVVIEKTEVDTSDKTSATTPKADDALTQALIELKIIVPAIHKDLYPNVLGLLKASMKFVASSSSSLSSAATETIATICSVMTAPAMRIVIDDLLPYLGEMTSISSKRGAAATIQAITSRLDIHVVPYIAFLLSPILSCISSQDNVLRQTVASSFATIVKLMPLESTAEAPTNLSESLLAQREQERRFFEQLLDGKKLDRYVLPIKILADLRHYQQEGVNWLAFLNKYHLHGILCDDMGLGKTLQALCIIAGNTHTVAHRNDEHGLPSLVVCPPTLVAHWVHEVEKFLSQEYLLPMAYIGTPAERERLRHTVGGRHVMIMSYEILRNDIPTLSKLHFNYCILDEGHIIKNSKTKITQAVKLINANNRLILSGTPVQNNVLELWSLFDFLMPGFLGTEKQFSERYSKPILAARDSDSATPQQQQSAMGAMDALHRQVLPFLLRRMKQDVLNDLPPKIVQDFYCELSPLQIKLYDEFAKQNNIGEILSASSTGEADTKQEPAVHIFKALQMLRKICDHPLLLKDSNPGLLEGEDLHDITHSPKLSALKDLLQQCGIGLSDEEKSDNPSSVAAQHRVLIFAQLKSFLDIVEEDLFKAHMPSVTYLRLDGSTPHTKRHDVVVKFNEDPTIDVLLLTTQIGGLGLNLTGADTIIFLEHDWNPSKDLQAMDRAHRIGQTKVVNVYRLITKGTLEEKIMGLQNFKLKLANTVITRDNQSLSTMDTARLLDLFNTPSTNSTTSKSAGASEGDTGLGGRVSTVLTHLQELWDQSQYDEFQVDNFMQQLSGKP
ncbi:TATA-binding protein-associated factor 172 [Pelomyxa schiedti]|nr:TATA-binding protein-associated factor 172 [Pelomyxa schiedti]